MSFFLWSCFLLKKFQNLKELQHNNETVLKAKQESFRVLNEDLARKQKLIDDQNVVISSLKEKIENLEEAHSQSRLELENRLSEKETDLKTKIASFEANLYEGRQYFEEMLNEKDKSLSELRQKVMQLSEESGRDLLTTDPCKYIKTI